jgi:hypothetical protein
MSSELDFGLLSFGGASQEGIITLRKLLVAKDMGFVEVREQLRRVRGALARMLTDTADIRHEVSAALQALDEGERLLDQVIVEHSGTALRRGTPKSYYVEKRDKQEFLTEQREDEDGPFRVARAIYDALVKVMSRFEDLVRYDDIARAVKKEIGQVPPEYQIRLVLRFWAERGVIERTRARYRRSPTGAWPAVAQDAWRDARRSRPV